MEVCRFLVNFATVIIIIYTDMDNSIESVNETDSVRQERVASEIDRFFGGWSEDPRTTDEIMQQGKLKAQLADILMLISWGDISIEYFGKSGSWLYHKLNGIDGNKKPTEFTLEERYLLKGALIDLSERIRRAAENIE